MIELGTRVVYRRAIRELLDSTERDDVGTVINVEPTRVHVKWDSGWELPEFTHELVVEGSGR
jgi:hypothetical protein